MSHASFASRCLARNLYRTQISESISQTLISSSQRSYATHTTVPFNLLTPRPPPPPTEPPSASRFEKDAIVTVYKWPSMAPAKYVTYSEDQLNLPMRKDLLHRAVVFEGDATRAGTASTKHRTEVKSSGRKRMPQKGTGRARNKDSASPILRGGGVVHGPRARDFSTELPAKIYNLAYRTALSHRYYKGELIVTTSLGLDQDKSAKFLANFFEAHEWGKGNKRTLVIANGPNTVEKCHLKEQMDKIGKHAELQWLQDVDVKDLLSFGRIIIEQGALQSIFGNGSRKDEFWKSIAERRLPPQDKQALFQHQFNLLKEEKRLVDEQKRLAEEEKGLARVGAQSAASTTQEQIPSMTEERTLPTG